MPNDFLNVVSYTMLHSHQQCMRDLIAPHSHQQLVLSLFSISLPSTYAVVWYLISSFSFNMEEFIRARIKGL